MNLFHTAVHRNNFVVKATVPDMNNRTVLITGSSSGFGKAAVLMFARHGWNVIATQRSPEKVGADYAAFGERVLVVRLDVQDAASIETAVAAGIARFGAIDVLVNNAGYSVYGVFEGISREQVRQQFDVNLFGVMDVTRAVLPHMRARRSGVIVNISSGAGVFTLPMISLYHASKFALEGFSESLSYELLSQGIVVKIVEPGGVTSTAFGQRMAQEFANVKAPSDYEAFVARTHQVFESLRAQRLSSSDDVASVILHAATDGTERLRYVATPDIEPLVRARRETSEESYLNLMRSRFLVRGPLGGVPAGNASI